MFKLLCGVALLACGAERAAAFAIKGPYETFQIPDIGYLDPDLGGPHNLGEEFRRNAPVVYYTFDQTFLDYFGSNGVAAVEAAFAVLNGTTNVSTYSRELSEWPLEAQRYNFRAQALFLTDLKSFALGAMMEQMGLAEAERWVWALHDREVQPGLSCPFMDYFVIKRNFDPVPSALDVFQPTSYVNGTLYSYLIVEFCTGPPWLADAVEFSVDPLANTYTAVSSAVLPQGAFFTGLTRDDVGGLRYLMRTNNINIEDAGAGTLTVFTNFNATQLLFTSNLTLLVNEALTNSAAALQALYPNLVITDSQPIYTNLVTTNLFFYFTNYPWLPAGTFMVAVGTNVTTNVTTWFSHSFGNVVTNTYYTNGFLTVLETNITTCAFGYPGQLCTNVTARTVFTNFINGEYFILPTNSDCGVFIINTQLTSLSYSTNTPQVATNASGNTNLQFSQSYVYPFTNHVYVIHPVPCLASNLEPRQGIEHVQFVRYDGAYDSLLDIYNYPITNSYTLVSVPLTNGTPTPRTVRRPIPRPDIIITAADLMTEQSTTVRGGTYAITGFGFAPYRRNLTWRPHNLFNLHGPGTIDPNLEMAFNKVSPFYLNIYDTNAPNFGLDEASQLVFLDFHAWGSFDGSTNAPVVYPNGTSIENYELGIMVNVQPPYLPQGYLTATSVHTNYYSAQLTVSSYSPNFVLPATWSRAPNSPDLPPGLGINEITGLISGFPTQVGTFDFTLRVTDSGGRVHDRSYFITIAP